MITLITGGPGLGKTALALKLLITEYTGRAIFTNIRGLTLDHQPLPDLKEWTRKENNGSGTSEYFFTFPAGAIIIIDECQQFFRPRSSGSAVPPYVQAFETHRHTGVDFVLITQGSRLIDSNLRSLVKGGRHIVLRSSFIGRFRYERSEVIDEESKTELALASRVRYKLPSEVYNLYKSSELHTKLKRPKLPVQIYVLFVALIIGSYLSYNAYTSVKDKTQFADSPAPESSRTGAENQTLAPEPEKIKVPASIATSIIPKDMDNHFSAPLYAGYVPEPVLPYVLACISSKDSCICYTDKAIPIRTIVDHQCRARAAGEYHDPYPLVVVERKKLPESGGLPREFVKPELKEERHSPATWERRVES